VRAGSIAETARKTAEDPAMTVIVLVLAGNLVLAGLFSLVAVVLD
jgi:hypothetical protein